MNAKQYTKHLSILFVVPGGRGRSNLHMVQHYLQREILNDYQCTIILVRTSTVHCLSIRMLVSLHMKMHIKRVRI